jgi:hypothetical protein
MAEKGKWIIVRTLDGKYGITKSDTQFPIPMMFNLTKEEAKDYLKKLYSGKYSLSYLREIHKKFKWSGLKKKLKKMI